MSKYIFLKITVDETEIGIDWIYKSIKAFLGAARKIEKIRIKNKGTGGRIDRPSSNQKKISYININIRKKSTKGGNEELEVNSVDSGGVASEYLFKQTSA